MLVVLRIQNRMTDHPATAVAYTWDAATSTVYHFRFQHHFFHAALIQRFIARSAKLAESYDLLWRTGLLLKVEGTLARIQVFPEEGRIEMQVRGANPAELIERRLGVNASASISQQAVSAFGTQSASTTADNANRAEVTTYSLSPYLRGRLLGEADYQIRLAYSTSGSSSACSRDSLPNSARRERLSDRLSTRSSIHV